MIKETITFTFKNEEQQKRFHARLRGVPKTDEEWDEAVSDEAVRQILTTPDEDVLAGRWPPLVKSVTRDEDSF